MFSNSLFPSHVNPDSLPQGLGGFMHTDTFTHMLTHRNTHTHLLTQSHTYEFIHACTWLLASISTHAFIHKHTHVLIQTYTKSLIDTNTHTQTHSCTDTLNFIHMCSRMSTPQNGCCLLLLLLSHFRCLTLCDPRDGSPQGSPVPGILQAITLEWIAISFSNE